MSSLQQQSDDAVADEAMKEKLDSLLLEHRQALFSVLEMDRELQRNKETAANKAILLEAALTSAVVLLRAFLSSVFRKDREQRKETAQQRKNGIAALLQEGADKLVAEEALNSVMVLHREALNLVLKKNRAEQWKETANNEQQNNNEIIHLKKEVVQWKETAEDWKKELVQWKEIAEDWKKELLQRINELR